MWLKAADEQCERRAPCLFVVATYIGIRRYYVINFINDEIRIPS